MSSYYVTTGKEVSNGNTAEDLDLNNVNTDVGAAFDLVEADVLQLQSDQEVWANIAKDWAIKATEVESGLYSSKYYSEASATSAAESAASAASIAGLETDINANTLKLSGIESGAEVNNISDINAGNLTDTSNADPLHSHSELSDYNGTYIDVATNVYDILVTKNLDITGDIKLSGIVDGRDVATDGTKLDGIESGAEVNSGLESVHEGFYTGYRLVGEDPANHGDIGANSVDMTYCNITSSTIGATGSFSFSAGNNTTASGFYSTALGNTTVAAGQQSMAVNSNTVAQNTAQFSCGYYNKGTSSTTVLEVGAGSSSARANVFEVHRDGNIVMPAIPTTDPGIVGALWNDSGTLKISL